MILQLLDKALGIEAEHPHLQKLLEEIRHKQQSDWWGHFEVNDSPAVQAVKVLPRPEQAEFVLAVAHYMQRRSLLLRGAETLKLRTVLLAFLRYKLPFDEAGIVALLAQVGRKNRFHDSYINGVANATSAYITAHGLSEHLRESIMQAVKRGRSERLLSTEVVDRLKKLERSVGEVIQQIGLDDGEPWADRALQQIETSEQREAWVKLVALCGGAASSKPSQKWITLAAEFVNEIGIERFQQYLLEWLPLFKEKRIKLIIQQQGWVHGINRPQNEYAVTRLNERVLRGLVWASAPFATAASTEAMGELALVAYRKQFFGVRSQLVGNGCVWFLTEVGTMDAVAKLAVLKLAVKHRGTQNYIERALERSAAQLGLTRSDIDELLVPTYGLSKVGKRLIQMGSYTAEMVVSGKRADLHWFKPDGSPQKSIPKEVKTTYRMELNRVRKQVKAINGMLSVQKRRLEGLYLKRTSWLFPMWEERYHNHLLVGTIARRLIWCFTYKGETTAAIWDGTRFVTAAGNPIPEPNAVTTVRLWHPLDEGDDVESVLAWRTWLETHQIEQPFKQAHRELYLLTDAEVVTERYSNRFAAHVLKQHQFNALCLARGWRNSLRLMVDDTYPPARLDLPLWNLRAEFWVEGVGDGYGQDTNETGTYLCVSTDQVRFYRRDAAENSAHAGGGGYSNQYFRRREINEPLPLAEIPPLVLSEVLRDIDLFVGVASIGNDPTWEDGGANGRHQTYWHNFSFGTLSATAETRKAVLQRLIPRLKIADRCSFDGRFLVVRGQLRTYNIHLGSGNILMEPNDQYLCIVPAQFGRQQKKAGQLYLPFEGDQTLAIVLSKAMLLAADDKIKDETIVRQIHK